VQLAVGLGVLAAHRHVEAGGRWGWNEEVKRRGKSAWQFEKKQRGGFKLPLWLTR
jgi:hypothetical protein